MTSTPTAQRTPEEILAGRAARLQRLEQQADWLKKKVASTNQRGSALCSKLEELHEQYGPAATAAAAADSTETDSPTTATSPAPRSSPSAAEAMSTTAISPTAMTSSSSSTAEDFSATATSPTATSPTATSPTARTSSSTVAERTPEEVLAARAERLSRLEQQCSSLLRQMNRTSQFGSVLSSRLEELHEQYGADPTPTPAAPPPPAADLPAATVEAVPEVPVATTEVVPEAAPEEETRDSSAGR
ncbi:hypothetical protein ONE63_003698 [Megalurothrips usitatus]|uniref:Uncharacterized protein n=1 Tax=Megalurothrips usitatus TaxID=439358 RepID=A0AAV7X4L8_9NEOP|nr:hypothetical protein ONE63_003698 [Megalurothrips usitatus]